MLLKMSIFYFLYVKYEHVNKYTIFKSWFQCFSLMPFCLSVNPSEMKLDKQTVDSDEVAHYMLPHPDLHSLSKCVISLVFMVPAPQF